VTTHAPFQALACPQKNAFGTPDAGVPAALPFDQKRQFWNGQRPRLANDLLVVVYIMSFPTRRITAQMQLRGKL
jgi:hypothetical protein